MDRVRWHEPPERRPRVAVTAFAGWGDAGEASTAAVDHLIATLPVHRLASIDPDPFFDFTVRRPEVEIVGGGTRRLVWPETRILEVEPVTGDPGLLVVRGEEPHLRWQSFAADLVEVFEALGVEQVVSLGAFIGQVPHTLPVPLVGSAADPSVLTEHHLFASAYEGPTGIVGVLGQVLAGRGIPAVSVWAAVPHYLSNQGYPPGALALLDKALEIAGIPLDTSLLQREAADFRATVDAAVADSEELTGYVRELEDGSAEEGMEVNPESGTRLVEEIERFLRGG